MRRFYKPSRIVTILIIVSVILVIYTASLYRLQHEGAASAIADAWLPGDTTIHTVTQAARRGDILDRNGKLLVSSRAAYNISLSRKALLNAEDTNGAIESLIYAAIENGVEYNDSFPVTVGAPFEYVSDMTATQRSRLDQYFEYFKNSGLSPDVSASDLIVWMKDHYGLDYTTSLADTRLIIGIRYELEIRVIINTSPYVFATDVSTDFLAYVEEQSIPGVYTETSSVRVYHTEYAAHLLGYISQMTPEQYEYYETLGYAMNAYVGQTGVELAFEEYLHGTDGVMRYRVTDTGMVVDVETITEPVPGENVYLSIDIDLQAAAEESLENTIAQINTERSPDDWAEGGSVVVTDPGTGEVLVCASYPSYDIKTFRTDYAALAADSRKPLLNRATQEHYNPGSTFKMVTAYAALCSDKYSRWTTIFDPGIYTEYPDYQPRCWIYNQTGAGHGSLDMVGALKHSCNYYFYTLGDNLGSTAMANASRAFGLGSKTGIEINEIEGTLATPEYKLSVLNEGWVSGDNLLTSIGQGHNHFTPVQLCNYVATIANNGVRHSLSLLNSTKSADYSETTRTTAKTVAGTIEETDYIEVLQEGMRAVTGAGGTAYSVFGTYPIKVAAKTGTVQSDTASTDNGVFVCYAPAYSPELAISVVVEKGGSGAAIMSIGRDILDSYFLGETADTVAPEGVLIP